MLKIFCCSVSQAQNEPDVQCLYFDKFLNQKGNEVYVSLDCKNKHKNGSSRQLFVMSDFWSV